MDISNERKRDLKQAYKEKAAAKELRRRIRNTDDFRRLRRFCSLSYRKDSFTGYPKVELPALPPLSPSVLMDKWVEDLFNKRCKPLGYKRDEANFRLIQPDELGKIINFLFPRFHAASILSQPLPLV